MRPADSSLLAHRVTVHCNVHFVVLSTVALTLLIHSGVVIMTYCDNEGFQGKTKREKSAITGDNAAVQLACMTNHSALQFDIQHMFYYCLSISWVDLIN